MLTRTKIKKKKKGSVLTRGSVARRETVDVFSSARDCNRPCSLKSHAAPATRHDTARFISYRVH